MENRFINKRLIALLTLLLCLVSCEKTLEYYYGLPMQPKFFEDTEWQKVINIFGILRPETSTEPMSFVFLERTYPTKGAIDEDLTITDAEATIYSTDVTGQKNTFRLNYYTSSDSGAWIFPRFISTKLKPQPGSKYELKCSSVNLPTVHCETYMPYEPRIIQNTLTVDNKSIRFTLACDSLALLYDIYLFSTNDYITKRLIHKDNKPLEVDWQFEKIGNWQLMAIYAYDKNMASYLSTATSSFYSFNTFRPPVTTVDGGFGVFGAMNLLLVDLSK
jgi:hypothetical protein